MHKSAQNATQNVAQRRKTPQMCAKPKKYGRLRRNKPSTYVDILIEWFDKVLKGESSDTLL